MANVVPTQGPGGVEFGVQDATVTLQAITCLKGAVLAVDMDTVDSGFRYTHVRAPATADFVTATNVADLGTFFCVALEAQATSGGKVKVRFAGVVDVLPTASGISVGDSLVPADGVHTLTESSATTSVAGTGAMIVAKALEASAASLVPIKVLFDGIHGFGRSIDN